ncbi:MAG: chemotaxis protein CheD [Phycisphaerae bacterium]
MSQTIEQAVKHVVGVADCRVSDRPDEIIVTHALGSCLGVTAYDPAVGAGGMLHVMMPSASINPEKAKVNPYMFVDTGVPAFFRKMYEFGCQKKRMVIKVAGGANIQSRDSDKFAIGKRNFIMLKKLFWKNGILIDNDDVGGVKARTMYLEIATGNVWLSSSGNVSEL